MNLCQVSVRVLLVGNGKQPNNFKSIHAVYRYYKAHMTRNQVDVTHDVQMGIIKKIVCFSIQNK